MMRALSVWMTVSLCLVAGCDGGGANSSTSGADTTGETDAAAVDSSRGTDSTTESDDVEATDTSGELSDSGRDTESNVTDSASDSEGEIDADPGPIRILVFTKTEGFRHDSIPAGVEALSTIADDRAWQFEHTEDAGRFTPDALQSFDVVVWLNTTGDVLDSSQQNAFEQWIQSGGGYVGIHAAADTEYDWDWYGTLMGAWFESHPSVQTATIAVEDRNHPATDHLAATWMHRDEWYNFKRNPRDDVEVLMAVDESTYDGGEMGDDHPIAWYHEVSGGRAFYTGLGHTSEAFGDPDVREHLTGAIRWAARP